jgi:hypothetical protein
MTGRGTRNAHNAQHAGKDDVGERQAGNGALG